MLNGFMPSRIISGLAELRTLVGQEVGQSEWYQIDQARITKFAETTNDHQWIHLDAARARTESPYFSTIAHGFLTLSMLSEFSRDAVDIQGEFKMRINYGLNRVRFPAPVPAGARVRGRFTLAAVEDFDGGAQVVWTVIVEVENGAKPAVAAEWLTRLYL
jgi:acyl dehydratase